MNQDDRMHYEIFFSLYKFIREGMEIPPFGNIAVLPMNTGCLKSLRRWIRNSTNRKNGPGRYRILIPLMQDLSLPLRNPLKVSVLNLPSRTSSDCAMR